MEMNYNDIAAPKFVDFGGDFEEEGEGDSWFSNDSTAFDSADISLDDSKVVENEAPTTSTADTVTAAAAAAAAAISMKEEPAASSSSNPLPTAPPTSAYFPTLVPAAKKETSPINALPASNSSSTTTTAIATATPTPTAMDVGSSSSLASASSSAATTPAAGSATRLVTREEFEKNHKIKTAHFAASPTQQKRTNSSSLERKNSRRRSLRKAGANRSARKAAIRAMDKMTPKKPAAKQPARSGGITNVEPFQLSTESRAKRVRAEPSTSSVASTPPTKRTLRKIPAKDVEAFSVSNKPTAASQAQRAVFKSAAEMQLKFITKTPDRFRTRKMTPAAVADQAKDSNEEKKGRTILDPKILQGKGHLPTKKKQAATCPKSPAFALKNRKRRRPEEEAAATKTETKGEKGPAAPTKVGGEKAKSKALTGIKSALKKETQTSSEAPRKNVTIPDPFDCHVRSQEMLEHKEKTIEKVLEEEKAKREFHAQPLPDLSTAHIPPKKTIPPTNPKPFNLMTDERGVSKEQDFENRLKEEEEQLKKAVEFKAQVPTVLDQAPFVPKPPRKPLTEFKEFQLATNERAEVWEETEAKKAAQEAEMRAQEEENNRLTKLAEEREIKKMREEMVHKPIPIPNYKPLEIQPSDKPMTMPESPQWAKKK